VCGSQKEYGIKKRLPSQAGKQEKRHEDEDRNKPASCFLYCMSMISFSFISSLKRFVGSIMRCIRAASATVGGAR
jgi:hypothetical protein